MPDDTDPPVRVERRADPSLVAVLQRSLEDAAAERHRASEQRTQMTAAIHALTAATTEHSLGAATRHVALLGALATRDAGAVAAVAAVTSERAAASNWLRESAERVAREVWPLLRVPVGIGLAYWGASLTGALPAALSPAAAGPAVAEPSTAPVPAPAGLLDPPSMLP